VSSFTEQLQTTQISIKPRRWRLDRGFRYYIGKEGGDLWIDVLPGFVFDGGSIPRAVWFVDAPMGDGSQSYCLHDIMYAARVAPRNLCDLTMLEGLQVLGMGRARRNLIYNQVWMWGWVAWNRHTQASVLEARQFVRTSFPLLPIDMLPA
jgi:hypothetical protein